MISTLVRRPPPGFGAILERWRGRMRSAVSVAGVLIVLAGCGPGADDAKKAGFDSVEEMKQAAEEGYGTKAEYDQRYLKYGFFSLDEMFALQGRGYQTKLDYLRVKQLTPRRFIATCLKVNRISYAYKCRDKRVSWTVELIGWEGDDARLRVLETEDPSKASGFSVDSDTFIGALGIMPVLGAQFEIDGRIGARRVRHPEIDDVTYASRLGQ